MGYSCDIGPDLSLVSCRLFLYQCGNVILTWEGIVCPPKSRQDSCVGATGKGWSPHPFIPLQVDAENDVTKLLQQWDERSEVSIDKLEYIILCSFWIDKLGNSIGGNPMPIGCGVKPCTKWMIGIFAVCVVVFPSTRTLVHGANIEEHVEK